MKGPTWDRWDKSSGVSEGRSHRRHTSRCCVSPSLGPKPSDHLFLELNLKNSCDVTTLLYSFGSETWGLQYSSQKQL